jgi:dipeptidyl aminopeptidase/acylaminoacyl peptidase
MIRLMRSRILLAAVLALSISAPPGIAQQQNQKAIQLADILTWKRIQSPQVSSDGQWLAYRLAPAEGNAEVVLTSIKDGKEQRFAIGEAPRGGGGGRPGAAGPAVSRDLAFSDDAKWLAFLAYPTVREAKTARRARRPIESKVILVELATGKKTEFEKIRRFAFSGERSTAIALQRYPAAGPSSGNGAPGGGGPQAPAAGGGTPPAEPRPTASDLILYDLTNATELNIGNVSDFAFDKKGDWLAWTIEAQDKVGNGIQLRNMATGAVTPLDSAKASYTRLTWTEKGDGLAVLRGAEDKNYNEQVYALVAFKNFMASTPPVKVIYDPAKDKSFPAGMSISPNRSPVWMADFSAVTFGIRELTPKKETTQAGRPGGRDNTEEAKPEEGGGARPAAAAKPEEDPEPGLVLWHWKDPRLQPMQQVQETQDRTFSFLCLYRPADEKFIRLADDALRQVTLAPEQEYAFGHDVREYEREGNMDGKRFQDVYSVDLKTGERKLALKKARWPMGPSPDGRRFLYYNDGQFFLYDAATGESVNLTKNIPAVFYDTDDDHNVVKPPNRPLGWSKDSDAVLLTDGYDLWKVPVRGGAAVNLTVNGKKEQIRYRSVFRLDPEARNLDFSKPMYVSAYGEWTKKSGIGIIEPGKAGVRMLQWGDAAYSQLLKAKNADTYLYTRETVQEYPNYYAANASLENGRKLTDANPQQKDFLWTSGSRLIDYTSSWGVKLQAALYLPANYEPGKSYPTLVYIYEKLSQSLNNYPQPAYNGFNIAAYTSNGYAVLEPDITYRINDPGVSAAGCILPALKAAIATGIVDAKRVGLQGHSWGGYQTAFMVTQTDAFAAAVAGAPLTDMIAMYNAIYWNSGSTNQPIFESSQGRFSGGPWENPDAYIRNSPVYNATKVNTPLMILHNDKDGAVDWTQGIEYFNTLRRLGKKVILLQYKGENHGLSKPEDMKDYTVRMREFFDHYLKGAPAPKWMEDGIPLLKMKEHLDSRKVPVIQ